MTHTDEELVALWQNGTPSAFDTLVQRHTPGVYTFVRRLTGDEEAATDITQETFIKAWRGLPKFKSGARFTSWLFQIARNSTTDYARRKRPALFSQLSHDDTQFEDTLVDKAPSSEDLVLLAEDKAIVDQALRTLTPQYQEILMLRYQEDMTFEEAAEVLSIPLNTAKSRGRRALEALRLALHPNR